MKTHIWNY